MTKHIDDIMREASGEQYPPKEEKRKKTAGTRKANRQAYAEPYRDLKTRVGFALVNMRKALGADTQQVVAHAMIEAAIEILEGES